MPRRFARVLVAAAILSVPGPTLAYDGECTPDFGAYAKHIAHITVERDGIWASGTAVWIDTDKLISIRRTFDHLLSNNSWSAVTIRRSTETDGPSISLFEKQNRDQNTPRVQGRRFGELERYNDEGVVVIELKDTVPGAAPVTFAGDKSMQLGKPVFSVLYADNGYWPQLRYAAGHIFKPEGEVFKKGGDLDPALLYAEMVQRPEPKRGRDVVGRSSEGSPVFTCEGALMGIISGGLTQKTSIGILPTAWGVPNVTGLRVSMMSAVLMERMKK